MTERFSTMVGLGAERTRVEDLALVVGLMLLTAVASIGIGALMAVRALVRRRPSLAAWAHAVLVPGTVVAVLIIDTLPGVVFLAAAALAHLLAVWAWAFRRSIEEPTAPPPPEE